MNKLYLGLTIHSHQPVGNFENVFETAYQKSYLPFIEILEGYPLLKVTLHYSGILIDWFEKQHPEFLERLRRLCHQERIEVMTGGHYEPILSILPETDRKAQVEKLTHKLDLIFQQKPIGLWVAERVWEPGLAETLHDAGVDYVVLDDIHFLHAGLGPEELIGYFITEEKGKVLKVVPGSKKLRYTIPFADPSVTIDYLKGIARSHSDALAVMGDDCEKFGVWPKTYEHVYQNGWLRWFFGELEGNQDWLQLVCLRDYIQTHKPLGRIYLPHASYSEMMEWALPVKIRELQQRCIRRIKEDPEAESLLPLMPGGFWRNFLARYGESNFIHKKMLATSRRLEILGGLIPSVMAESYAKLQEAYDYLLRAQCNDAYWHGVFGGLYAPHLRTALLSNLIQANRLADELEYPALDPAENDFHFTRRFDFDANGVDELLVQTRNADVFIDPSDGATVREIDFKPCAAPIVNSIKRQEEYYHRYLPQVAGSGEDIKTIHEQMQAKERALDKVLRYDRYDKSCFRIFLFPPGKSIEDYDRQKLSEIATFAASEFHYCMDRSKGPTTYQFSRSEQMQIGERRERLEISKSFRIESAKVDSSRLSCELRLSCLEGDLSDWELGIENVINFLAPDAPDRYLTIPFQPSWGDRPPGVDAGLGTGPQEEFRVPLNWFGIVTHRPFAVFIDRWRQLEVSLCFEQPVDWWIVPIYTVSQSEQGYERIYQGSQILAVIPNLNWSQGSVLIHHWMEVRKLSDAG